MQGMTINYVLLAITGISTIQFIYSMVKGGPSSRRLFQPIFMMIVFVLVLIATIMGVDYNTFRMMIEGKL